jgi:hypothetical protein
MKPSKHGGDDELLRLVFNEELDVTESHELLTKQLKIKKAVVARRCEELHQYISGQNI